MEPSGGGPLLGEAFGGSSFAFPRLIFFGLWLSFYSGCILPCLPTLRDSPSGILNPHKLFLLQVTLYYGIFIPVIEK